MEVYIEYVIVDNLLIDWFILSTTQKICKLDVRQYKLWLISMFGTLVSIFSPYLSGIFLILAKILCSVLMPLFLLKKPNIKKFLITYLIFLLSTMIMGGACIMICYLVGIDYIANDGRIMIYNFPIGLALITCLCLYVIIKNLIKHFYNIKRLSKFLYDITLINNNQSFCFKGFLDSGNRVIDEKTNKPIVLVNFNVFSKLFPQIKLADILLKRYKDFKLKNMHEVEIKSLSFSSKILVFEIDNIMIEEKVFDSFMLGLSLKNFNQSLNADCILNPLIFEK